MKTFKIACLSILLCFGFQSHAQYNGGTGSVDSPFEISESGQLKYLSEHPGDWSNKSFVLTADIDMGGIEFTPIGNDVSGFYGNFNGQHHKIQNLTVTGTGENAGTGLFGHFSGTLKNLGVENISINAGGYGRVGALVGVFDGGTISNCYAKGGEINVGGGGWAGGIAGVLFYGGSKTITNCYSTVTINASWASGGIAGANRGEHIVDNVAFYGTVKGGGAITTVQNDPNNSQKSGIAPTHAYFAASTGATDNYATALSDEQLLDAANYTGFDFEQIWKIDSLMGFAVLRDSIPKPTLSFFDKIKTEKVISADWVEWKNFGPGMAGYNEEFWCHPTDTSAMFMSPDMYNTYGTWDNGRSWHTIKDCDGTGIDMRRVKCITFSHQNPDFGMAIDVRGYLYKTNNRGKTWTKTDELEGGRHSTMTVDPNNDKTWYIGAGNFWDVKANHRSKNNPLGAVYKYSAYGHILKSTNQGVTWKKINNGLPPTLDVGRIIVDPNNSNIVIMATNSGVYRSNDAGETWAGSANGLPNNIPRDMCSYYNPQTGEFILYVLEQTVFTDLGNTVGTVGGIYKSTDEGVSWQSITGDLAIDMTVINNYFERDRYQRAVAYWFGISKNDVKTRFPVYPASTFSVFNRIAVNPKNKNEIYISHNKKHDMGFGPGEVWKTTSGGQHWIACARDGKYWLDNENLNYWQARNNPVGTNIKFAHLQDEIYRNTESAGCRMLVINAVGEVFIGVDQQTIRSNNNGQSWFQVDDFETSEGSKKWVGRGDSNLPGRFMLLETGEKGRKLLCSGEHGLWQTTDLGNWPNKNDVAVEQIEGQNNAGGAHSISTVAVHPQNPNIIYIMMWRQEHRGKFRRSIDGGKTWENIATIFEADNNSWEDLAAQYSLQIDPVNPQNIYFCSIRKPVQEVGGGYSGNLTKGDFGVYHSADGGYTWNLKNNGLPENCSVRRIALHPDDPNTIYAALNQYNGSEPGGLFKSTNKAESWSEVTIPQEITSVNNIFIDRNTKHLYISCGYRSGPNRGGGVYRSTDDGKTWEQIFKAPYVWQCETSPVNPNLIVISVPGQISNIINEFLNPGIYLSHDAGKTWLKINKGLGQSDRIVDVKPDPENEQILWCAAMGSGWFKAVIKSDSVKAVCNNAEVFESEKVTLDASGSVGSGLKFFWNVPSELQLVDSTNNTIGLIAPQVKSDTTFTVELIAQNSHYSDTIYIQVRVKNNITFATRDKFSDIKIYPNPASNYIFISGIKQVEKDVEFSLFSLSGDKIMQLKNLETGLLKIKIDHLKSGVYFAKISSAKRVAGYKIVKI